MFYLQRRNARGRKRKTHGRSPKTTPYWGWFMIFKNQRFNGSDYEQKFDHVRLTGQIERVFNLMQDANWRTLEEISKATGDPAASVSAQLRHLRKPRFGGHMVLKKPRGERSHGFFEYRLMLYREKYVAPTKPKTDLFEDAA